MAKDQSDTRTNRRARDDALGASGCLQRRRDRLAAGLATVAAQARRRGEAGRPDAGGAEAARPAGRRAGKP